MRLKERIPVFLDNVNWNKLAKRWDLDISAFDYIKPANEPIAEGVIDYWNENYDQRFGQVLINLNSIEDTFRIWHDEEQTILLEQGCKLRDIILWGNNFNKEGERLPKTKWILVKDLNTDHIKAILDTQFLNLTADYIKMFKDELKLRKLC